MKLNFRAGLTSALLFVFLCSPISMFGNWGLEVGRANEGDNARLLTDWLAMKMARNRIESSTLLANTAERQRSLLALPQNSNARPDVLLDAIYEWWLKDVLGPAEAISRNPAATCAQAQLATEKLLGMMRNRQLLGL